MEAISAKRVISARADLYQGIRTYFQQSDVLEVEVPLLATAGTTDPQIDSFRVSGLSGQTYLQTSPEFFLKRLLAEINQSCFCITRAFRDEEHGRNHNPEFSMLEWYRLGFDLDTMIEDCLKLIQLCLGSEQQVTQETYRSLFWSHLNIDPHEARFGQLEALVKQHTSYKGSCASASEALQLLLSTLIEPKLSGLTVVRDFPQDQAALARLDADESGQVVAKRFEIYLDQVELANGYYELIDAHEQRARFEKDNRVRKELGRRQMELDEALISAMERGLPECSGVSIGLDRLLMAKLGCDRIDSVLLFPWQKI